jgi:glycerol-3-phosphate dehydrogenase
VNGLVFLDQESGEEHTLYARCVINATGPFCDELQRQDDPQAEPMIAPSQGVHIVLDRSFLPSDSAIMVPHTRDGRVMFAIPWHNHVVVGTTDTPIAEPQLEPKPQEGEIEFILETASDYLAHRPRRSDIVSAFTRIRPLVHAAPARADAALSRYHTINIWKSGLLTIAEASDHLRKMAGLPGTRDRAGVPEERALPTEHLSIHAPSRSGPQRSLGGLRSRRCQIKSLRARTQLHSSLVCLSPAQGSGPAPRNGSNRR